MARANGLLSDAAGCVQEPARLPEVQDREQRRPSDPMASGSRDEPAVLANTWYLPLYWTAVGSLIPAMVWAASAFGAISGHRSLTSSGRAEERCWWLRVSRRAWPW